MHVLCGVCIQPCTCTLCHSSHQQVNAILTVFIMRSLYKFYKGVGEEYSVQNDDTKAKDLVKLVEYFVPSVSVFCE